jgi:Cdc6-like AAA superfamily ATPase
MGFFDNMLSDSESLIKDSTALDFEFIPKEIKYRENEQHYVADSCFKPLFSNRSGRNLLIYGAPGIGKTVAIKNILDELEEKSDEIQIFFINCWHHNTTYKILIELANQFGYRFTQNKKTVDLYKLIEDKLKSSPCAFVFDEIDKVEDVDFLYFILEKFLYKSVVLITNYKSWLIDLDERVKSRLMPELLEFREYNLTETRCILDERKDYAFVKNSWNQESFDFVVNKTFEIKDIRSGLFLLKESALIAEEKFSKKIVLDNVKQAVSKLIDFTIKNSDSLDDESKKVLEIIKLNSGKKIGDLFKLYEESDGKSSYKTFQRKIAKLEEGKFVELRKNTGKGGNTTFVSIVGSKY